tara:strand:+ start:1305 stop:1865 length:561 start_codon:yes stop_codon:yes gene_type:complete
LSKKELKHIEHAAKIVIKGGVIAYPTEGVFGLGCIPDNYKAVNRILNIKKRDIKNGLIVIASSLDQLKDWVKIKSSHENRIKNEPEVVTWIVKKTQKVPIWVSGEHDSIAIRITKHPIVTALCDISGSSLISTSANISGEQPPSDQNALQEQFCDIVDYIVPGECGMKNGSSMIKCIETQKVIRSR